MANTITGAPAREAIASWSAEQKLIEAARLAGAKLPAGMQAEFAQLFEPRNLALTGAMLTAWAGSHLLGVGFAVDALMLLLMWATTGAIALDAYRHVLEFVRLGSQAHSRAELERAAAALARAVSLVGATAIVALVTRRATPAGRAVTDASGAPTSARAAASATGLVNELALNASRVQRLARIDAVCARLGLRHEPPLVKARIGIALEWIDGHAAVIRAFMQRSRPAREPHIDIEGWLRGIDLNSEVRVVKLRSGTRLTSFETPGRGPGNFYAKSGAAPEQRGISAGAPARERVDYEVVADTYALESRASATLDTWTAGRSADRSLTPTADGTPRFGEYVPGGAAQWIVADPSAALRRVAHTPAH